MLDNFNKDIYLEALGLFFWNFTEVDFDNFFEKYNIFPDDLLKNLIVKFFDIKDELKSLHYAYNELNSQNEEIIKENERLESEILELREKLEYYKYRFCTTHQQSEELKNVIRHFLNDLFFIGLLKDVEDIDRPLKVVFNEIVREIKLLYGVLFNE